MSNKIGALSVDLSLETQNFLNGLKDSQRETQALVKEFKPLTTSLKETGEAMSVVGDVIAGAMLEASIKTAEYGETIANLHDRSGVSTADLQKLGFAAITHGSSVEALGTSMKFLSKNMELASDGSKAQVQAFANLGITHAQIVGTGGSASAMFSLLSDRISGMADPSTHAADLTKVLGKSWTEMIPTMRLGSEELQKIGDHAEQLGLVLSQDAIEAAAKFQESIKALTGSVEGLGMSIGSTLIPVLQPYLDGMIKGVAGASKFIKAHEDLTVGVFGVAAAIGGTGGLLLALAGIGLAYPFVVSGFELVGAAAELAAAKIGGTNIVVGVFGAEVEGVVAKGLLAKFAVGLESVGIAAEGLGGALLVLTTGALVGIAAGIGYVVGKVINWATELAGLQSGLDKIIAWGAHGIPIIGDMANGFDATKASTELASEATKKLTESLDRAGISYDAAQLGNSNYVAGLGRQVTAVKYAGVTLAEFRAAFAVEAAKIQKTWDDQAKSEQAAADAADKYRKAVDALKNSVTPVPLSVSELNSAIKEMTAAGTPAIAITEGLGQQAEKYGKQLTANKEAVPEFVGQLWVSYEAQKVIAMGQKSLIDEEKQNHESASKLYTELASSDLDVKRNQLATERSMDDQFYANRIQGAVSTSVFIRSLPQIELPVQIAADAKALAEKQKVWDAHLKAVQQLSNQIDSEWSRSMNNMGKSTASAFADMVVKWQFNTDALVKIAESTGKSMLTAFMQGLITPLTDKLAKLGASLTDTVLGISKAENGSAGSNGGGLLGLFGGLLGGGSKGSDAVPAGWGSDNFPAGWTSDGSKGTAPSGGSSGGSGGGSGSSLTSGLEAAGIGAAIGVGVALVSKWYANMAHFKANELVKNFQEPFDRQFQQAIGIVSDAWYSGTLSKDDAQSADNQLHQLWGNTKGAVADWAAGDSKKETVRSQLLATEAQYTKPSLDWVDAITMELGGKAGVPAFGTGINNVPFDMLAFIHKGEAVIPAANNPANQVFGGGTWGRGNDGAAAQPITHNEINVVVQSGGVFDEEAMRKLLPHLGRWVTQDTGGIGTTVALKVKRLMPGLQAG